MDLGEVFESEEFYKERTHDVIYFSTQLILLEFLANQSLISLFWRRNASHHLYCPSVGP